MRTITSCLHCTDTTLCSREGRVESFTKPSKTATRRGAVRIYRLAWRGTIKSLDFDIYVAASLSRLQRRARDEAALICAERADVPRG